MLLMSVTLPKTGSQTYVPEKVVIFEYKHIEIQLRWLLVSGRRQQLFLRAPRARAAKRARRTHADSLADKHRRAVSQGIQGKVGRMAGVYDSPALAPATEETLVELQKLFPSQFVPDGCCI